MTEATYIALIKVLQLIAMGAVMALIISFIAWLCGYYHFPKPRLDDNLKITFWQVLGAFVVFFVLMVIVAPIATMTLFFIKNGGHWVELKYFALDPVVEGLFNIAAILITALGLLIYCLMLSKETRITVVGPAALQGPGRRIKDFLMGSCSWLVAFPIIAVIGQIIELLIVLEFHPPHEEQVAVRYLKMSISRPFIYYTMAFLIIFIIPIMEETLFRGFLQNWLRKKIGIFWAIAITSLIFSLFHYSHSQGWDNIELIASLYVLSCFLGYIYLRQQSLFASVGLHATFNGISILMLSLQ